MCVPLKPYYTINPSLIFQQNRDNLYFRNTKLNILLSKETDFTPHLFSSLNSLKNEYIISISRSILENERQFAPLLPKIYLLSALNKSLRGQKIIPIFADVHKKESLNILMLQTYLNQHGLQDVKFPIFECMVNNVQTIDHCSLLVMQKPSTELLNCFFENEAYATTIIIAFKNEMDDFSISSEMDEQIDVVERNRNFKIDFSKFYIEKEEFDVEKKLWKKRVLLYQDFLSLSKTIQEKEYYEVVDWYNREYEVLPIWYKRIGHVVKVLTGKRTFRSLFSGKLKKYKK